VADIGADGIILLEGTILKLVRRAWIEVAQIKDTLLALLKKIINIPVP
jgi:hypothetical protein